MAHLIVAIGMIAAFIALLAYLSSRKKKEKTAQDEQEKPKRRPKGNPVQALKTFRELVRLELTQIPSTADDRRRIVIRLYNLLLEYFAGCGAPREHFQTPDEFAEQVEPALRARANELKFVTMTFCRAYYGRFAPSDEEARRFVQCIATLGGPVAFS